MSHIRGVRQLANDSARIPGEWAFAIGRETALEGDPGSFTL